ncbi:MAG TPA: S9 family peptidase [Gemmatimonadaceae bacterium]|nr:S9 family peptidase [Gemmatimonadaceae bacterium]
MRHILFLAFGIGTAAATLPAQSTDEQLSIERIFTRRDFAGASNPELHWLREGGGTSYLVVRSETGEGSSIVRVDAASGRETVVAEPATLVVDGKPIGIEALTLSEDERKALLYHSSVQVWRQNTRGVYHVLDFATRRLTPISRQAGLQMFAKFSPDGRRVAFVRDNDLYVTDLASGQERRLTTDGSDVIINGTTDWVYEEELDLRDGFRWSHDSRRIAYWRFDQSAVRAFPLVNQLTLYPTVAPLRYPKAGEQNSRVRVGVLDLASGNTSWLDVGPDTGIYLARMDWVSADSLIVQRLPRRQNRIDLLMVSASSGKARELLVERDSAWVDVDEQPIWINGGRQFLWPSERTGWRQYFVYNRDGSVARQLTRDGADVTGVAGVDERRGEVYVIEAVPTPMQRHLIRYSLRDRAARTQLTTAPGTHSASLSPGARFLVSRHSTASTPQTSALFELPAMRQRRVLVTNDTLRGRLQRLAVRPPQFFKVPIPDGDSLNAYRIVPVDFDSTRRYPVLMYVYGGPGSQTVTDAYGGTRYLWHQMLAQRGFVVVSVDNRGTGARGRQWKKLTYLNLGDYETRDQMDAARWLATRSWVDGNRIGIWGWSYGGYMSSLAAGKAGALFRAAIAVAPVTDWRFYDTIYTERFMWVPQDNVKGYTESAPTTHARGMTAAFLLVHGTGDDNVHAQNSIVLADTLQSAGKPFELMLYPNRNHSISGGNTSAHLYTMMTRFVEEHLGPATQTLP